jgi:hypothetical protein
MKGKLIYLEKHTVLMKNVLCFRINKSSDDRLDAVKESKVIYVPDADDDIDPEEEDPDDDLYV